MRTIIRVQNMVISGLITAIAIMTGFYELDGWKLLLVAVMGFFLIERLLLEAERAFLHWRKSGEGKGKAKGSGGSLPSIKWFEHKMRYQGVGEKDRNPRSIAEKVQAGTRHDSPVQTTGYR